MSKTDITLPTIEEMASAGVHLGHRTTKWNPKMEQYILNSRNNVHIIDLEKTAQKLKSALDFIKETVGKGGVIILVGTTPAAKKIIEESAVDLGMPYVNERWLGGTLTNFKIMDKRLNYFRELERKRDAGELEKYTKKERHEFNEEIKKMQRKFGGIKNLTKIPDAILVLDPKKNDLAIKEANRVGVKVVALCDTNIDPEKIDYPIPANDDAISSLKLMMDYIVKAVGEGKKNIQEAPESKQ